MKKIGLLGAAMSLLSGATATAGAVAEAPPTDRSPREVPATAAKPKRKKRPARPWQPRPWQVGYLAARIPATDPSPLTRQVRRQRARIRAKMLLHDDKMAALKAKRPGGAAAVRQPETV